MERGQRIALIGAALMVAGAAFVLLSGGADDEDSTTARTEAQPTLAPVVDTIRVVDGEPAGGVKKITVEKGDNVRLEVRSADTAALVHVHGYDLSEFLDPSAGAVAFRFKADIEGVFEIELQEFDTQIARLSVGP